jgi:hypothetical protein
MTVGLKAGATYFAIVYPVGFVLGTLRVLLMLPHIGETGAVLLETPIMLAVSWIASRWSTNRFAVPAAPIPRLAMGVIAFALLAATEVGVSMLASGRTSTDLLDLYRSVPGIIGLAAQAGFALVPLIQALIGGRDR